MHTTYITCDLQPICNVHHDTCPFGSMPNSLKKIKRVKKHKVLIICAFFHFKVYFRKENKIIVPFAIWHTNRNKKNSMTNIH